MLYDVSYVFLKRKFVLLLNENVNVKENVTDYEILIAYLKNKLVDEKFYFFLEIYCGVFFEGIHLMSSVVQSQNE